MAERLSTGFRNAVLQTGSVKSVMANGIIEIYSGTQPTDANSAETGTLLCTITLSGGAFTPGSATNGINFGTATDGVLSKDAGETWSGSGVADGNAGWFRFYDNDVTKGASTTGIRFDGAIATSGAELNMANTNITTGGSVTIDNFDYTQPAS